MSRDQQNRQNLFQTWMEKDPALFTDLRVTGNDLFCEICERIINSSTPSKVKQHITGHASPERVDSKFFYEVTNAFIAADISLDKLNHPKLRAFFEKYADQQLPDSNTLRLRYVDQMMLTKEKFKKHYDTETESYTPLQGKKQRGKKRKRVKDPNTPKRPSSSFFWFSSDERAKVKCLNPEYGVRDVAKELGRRWANVEPETKSKYEALASKDKARYEMEMIGYKKQKHLDTQQAAVVVPKIEDLEHDEEDRDNGEDA